MYRLILIAAMAVLTMAPDASAQTTSEVTSTVLNASDDQPLPGATVIFIRAAPDNTRTGAAAALDGSFRLAVAPGLYRLRVSFVGYQPLERDVAVTGDPVALGRLPLAFDDAVLAQSLTTDAVDASACRGVCCSATGFLRWAGRSHE
ncbi:MAG: carboxypeptidase regulatory-like domain-containing protein [Rhodothermales bacterium]